jgi:ParB-like nuclease domain
MRELRPHLNNARTHSKKQIRHIANSIAKFGFCNPVLVDDAKQIIAGHGSVEAAKLVAFHAMIKYHASRQFLPSSYGRPQRYPSVVSPSLECI